MENITKIDLIEKVLPSPVLVARRSLKPSSIHLQDLNYDCLKEIFHHLDLAAQFSLLKSSKQFLEIILYDIWYPYYENLLDINQDLSIQKQTKDFQIDFLHLILKHFSKIKGISLEIFLKCLSKTLSQEFAHISVLTIHNFEINQIENILHLKEFLKFPNLQELELENICLEFAALKDFIPLQSLHLKNVKVLNDYKGEFLKLLLTPHLQHLTLKSLNRDNISFQNFPQISQCLQLQELNLSLHYLYDPRILDDILNLNSLKILTLDSPDNYYFTSKDHTIFYAILKIFSQNPQRSIRGLQINGMPEKIFYLCPYLQDLKKLNWFVTKIFHRKLDGSLEWKSDIPHVIKSFYDFLVDSKNLEKVYVKDNIFHKKRVLKEMDLVEKLQRLRRSRGYERLNIISDYKESNESKRLDDLEEGSVRFFIDQRQ